MPTIDGYQVFLSFSAPDTGAGFADFLYHSLDDAKILVFRHDEELHVSDWTDRLLKRAIDNSKIYIPIFSQSYARSQQCLIELEHIVENSSKSNGSKEILPIFFDVELDDVLLKTSLYCNAILNLKHEEGLSNEQVGMWRKALMKVGTFKRWEVKKCGGQGQLIKLIVEEVVNKLMIKHKYVTEHLVGINDRVAEVRRLLDVGSSDVRIIKIHGMGGIGKTTLAKVIFNQLCCHFGSCCCFLEDVRENSSKNGLIELQKELLRTMGIHAGIRSIDNVYYGMKRITDALHNKKVLIVLDDVDHSEQVEKLVGKGLHLGSRILITTRNKDVLQNFRPKYEILKYEMEVMSIDHAHQLFSKHAFGRDSPLKDYKVISSKIVCATGRLPLALVVLGSSLYQKGEEFWNDVLTKLSCLPALDVLKELKISYDALSFEQQQIFLDIACFFIGEDKTNAIYMWEDCGLHPIDGLDVLNSMCLIKIAENNTFWMHDQLRNLGREIVYQESVWNPEKCSRLWIYEETLQAIKGNEMKNNVQGLELDASKSDHDVVIESAEIERFRHLKYLKLIKGTFVGDLACCLTNLIWLFWSHPPRTSEATGMHLKNVVILQFSNNEFINDSNLQSSIKMARKLKVLSLESCHNIIRTPDFSGCQNLQRLTLQNCSNLREIDSTIGKLKCLVDLRIDRCDSLEGLPEEIGDLVNLKHFFVQRSKVKKLPYSITKLKLLKICLEFEPIKKI